MSDGSRRLVALLTTLAIAGCGGGKRVGAENDRLRSELLDLRDQVDDVEQRNRELEAQLAEALAARPDSLPPEVSRNTPRVASIEIGRLSHATDDGGNGVADTLLLYVKPTDGWGRFVQLAGELSAHAAVLPADTDATTIGRIRLGPAAVRDAYRSTMLGTHYTISVPIEIAGVDQTECLARVEFIDGHTGKRFEASLGIDLQP